MRSGFVSVSVLCLQAAAIDACRVLLQRLAPVRESLGLSATMAQLAAEARARRIPLQATGFHSSDIGGFDWETGKSVEWEGMTPATVPQQQAAEAAVTPEGASGEGGGGGGGGRVEADLADYFAIGVACVEVLLDVMTGAAQHRSLCRCFVRSSQACLGNGSSF